MRSARLIAARPAVVLVAHGSRDPRAAASTEALARAVRRARPEWLVRAAYLDHAGPRPLDVLSGLGERRAVLVPLLLTAAYHGRVDLPAVLAEAAGLPVEVVLADVLGPLPVAPVDVLRPQPAPVAPADVPRPPAVALAEVLGPLPVGPAALLMPGLLLEALTRRLAGALGDFTDISSLVPNERFDAVVLSAAGTRDPVARGTVEHAAAALGARLGVPARVAYASGVGPRAGEAVRGLQEAGARRVAVAGYFLAPGLLYDQAVESAREAGAVAVAEPLGDAPELVGLISARVAATGVRVLAAA
ncbi:cobalamin biosynthesis protein CbiX [Actinoplanes sp. SE50]|uniref:sirohydrochlorin chelatase n=1 Tax=unclassified Actinoplanes TaxID=2626549 RepID=UPI00023EE070|nr:MULTISPECIES: CbiX/SirB N-terminal domain-containing protein [unclassified Actinoplanes]AEV88439.1 Sirohydrochlorin cobaltochelatase [Actinoplanes sp. SE50/110]ATO86844.1 cobalamin biosynthesis protein CbiX [Actinoplanes sp. SE50]SLM04262.1 cobalamin biosynthesis protein CbiX [Actinoplanes sp. SE50/110]